MLLYNLAFPDRRICDESELYLRGGECREDGVYLKAGERVTFDTYFNCFSHIKFKRYTTVDEVELKLKTDGRCRASVCLYRGEDKPLTLAESDIDGEGSIIVSIEDLPDTGFVYFTLEAKEDCILRSGGWYCDKAGRDVKIGIVICTYKREQYVKRNIFSLIDYADSIADKFFDVFVVDNGQTLEDDFGNRVKVIPNENTGGSGGFTRGMREVVSGDFTHFLLMDDDIVFDTKTLYRTYSLLRVLKDEYADASVGGAMLVLNKPYEQFEMGADWNGLHPVAHRKRIDARDAKEIALNEEDSEFEYNGWFYMCMPVSAPKEYGYPLQLFIKCDDIEYGLRACRHIISTSGIAVWHEDFAVKPVPGTEYFVDRNELILGARFPKGKGAFAEWIKLCRLIAQQLIMQRYYSIALIFKAYDDFFKGPEYVFNLNAVEKYAEIRNACPQLLTEGELKDKYGISLDYDAISIPRKGKHRGIGLKHLITLNGYLIPKCFYKKGISQVEMTDFNYDGFYKRKRVLQYNLVTGKGFVTEIKKCELFKAGFKLIGYFFKMVFCYRKVAKKYRTIENN